jgi:hypothetical protein
MIAMMTRKDIEAVVEAEWRKPPRWREGTEQELWAEAYDLRDPDKLPDMQWLWAVLTDSDTVLVRVPYADQDTRSFKQIRDASPKLPDTPDLEPPICHFKQYWNADPAEPPAKICAINAIRYLQLMMVWTMAEATRFSTWSDQPDWETALRHESSDAKDETARMIDSWMGHAMHAQGWRPGAKQATHDAIKADMLDTTKEFKHACLNYNVGTGGVQSDERSEQGTTHRRSESGHFCIEGL